MTDSTTVKRQFTFCFFSEPTEKCADAILLVDNRMGLQQIFISSETELDTMSQSVLAEKNLWVSGQTEFEVEVCIQGGHDRKWTLIAVKYAEGYEPVGTQINNMSDQEYEDNAHRAWLSIYG